MNILILSGSPRKNGNTDLLVDAFAKGAAEKHHVEVVSVHDYTVHSSTRKRLGYEQCFIYVFPNRTPFPHVQQPCRTILWLWQDSF